jgi:hypothetical protein
VSVPETHGKTTGKRLALIEKENNYSAVLNVDTSSIFTYRQPEIQSLTLRENARTKIKGKHRIFPMKRLLIFSKNYGTIALS